MKITTDYLRGRFASFNAAYFGGKLPEPQFVVSNSRTVLGQFRCRRERKGLFGRYRNTGYMIKVSVYYDVTEREYDNVLLHEMIHYHIAYSGRRDSSAHGPLFRNEMERLNACGWNISVSTATRHWAVAERNRRTEYIVLALVTTDGRRLLSVVNPKYVARIDAMASRSPLVERHDWYTSADDYFASFPQSRSLRGRIMKHAEFDRRVKSMTPMMVGG